MGRGIVKDGVFFCGRAVVPGMGCCSVVFWYGYCSGCALGVFFCGRMYGPVVWVVVFFTGKGRYGRGIVLGHGFRAMVWLWGRGTVLG